MNTILSPINEHFDAKVKVTHVNWIQNWLQPSPPPREFQAIACPEGEGGYSVFAANYPGVISEGDTLEEAKKNITEAFLAMLEARREHGEAMEFVHPSAIDIPDNAKRFRIRING